MSPVVVILAGVMLTIGAFCALVRAERGPSMLDRVVAVDVLVATVLASVVLVSAWYARSDLVPVLVVLALMGFVGSVTIARFAATETDAERRILTREEAEAEVKARRDAAEADEEADDNRDPELEWELDGESDSPEAPGTSGTPRASGDEEVSR